LQARLAIRACRFPPMAGRCVLSPGRRLAYTGLIDPPMAFDSNKRGPQWPRVIVDGVRSKPFDHVTEIQFSADSKRLAYIGSIASMATVVVDEKQYAFDKARALHFSADGRHFFFEAFKDSQWRAVLDGQVLDADVVVAVTATVGGQWACHLQRDDQHMIRMGDGQLVTIDGVSRFDDVPFMARDGAGRLTAIVRRNGTYSVLRDRRLGPAMDWIGTAGGALSADGRFAYVCRRQDKMLAMIDDDVVGTFDDIVDYSQWQCGSKGSVIIGIRDKSVFLLKAAESGT
jgi:hypothetical protein